MTDRQIEIEFLSVMHDVMAWPHEEPIKVNNANDRREDHEA